LLAAHLSIIANPVNAAWSQARTALWHPHFGTPGAALEGTRARKGGAPARRGGCPRGGTPAQLRRHGAARLAACSSLLFPASKGWGGAHGGLGRKGKTAAQAAGGMEARGGGLQAEGRKTVGKWRERGDGREFAITGGVLFSFLSSAYSYA
jgi:hypothetical protein